MLWSKAHSRRKILCKSHSFFIPLVFGLLLGALAGVLFCFLGRDMLSRGIFVFRASADEMSFASALGACLRFPLFLYLSAFSGLAAQLVLMTLFARGFLLSYSIGCSVCAYGWIGLPCAFAAALFSGVLLLPLLVLLGYWSATRAGRRLDRAALVVGLLMLLVCALCALLETRLTPSLLRLFTF